MLLTFNSFIDGVCVKMRGSNSLHVQAKNMCVLVSASVELLSEDSLTENSKSTDVNVGHWATLSSCLVSQRLTFIILLLQFMSLSADM